MHTFKDAKDRTWELAVNCETVDLVKADSRVNILDLIDDESELARLVAAYPPLLAKFVYAMVRDQAAKKDQAGVDDAEFRRSISGDAWDAMSEALLDELVLFSRKHRRPLLQAVRERKRDVEQAGVNLALSRVQDQELRDKLVQAMDDRIRQRMAESLAAIAAGRQPPPAASDSATRSSSDAGTPPDSSAGPAPDATPGASSNGSPPAAGDPIPG
jgi:hypothetical protein